MSGAETGASVYDWPEECYAVTFALLCAQAPEALKSVMTNCKTVSSQLTHTHTHAHTHARTHARTHAHTHRHTHILMY